MDNWIEGTVRILLPNDPERNMSLAYGFQLTILLPCSSGIVLFRSITQLLYIIVP